MCLFYCNVNTFFILSKHFEQERVIDSYIKNILSIFRILILLGFLHAFFKKIYQIVLIHAKST